MNAYPARPPAGGGARSVAISVIINLQAETRRETGGKIEQLPNRHARLARIVAPRRNRSRDPLVETEEAIFCGRERGEIPKGFRAAVNPLRRIKANAAGMLLEQRPSTLNGEEGMPRWLVEYSAALRTAAGSRSAAGTSATARKRKQKVRVDLTRSQTLLPGPGRAAKFFLLSIVCCLI